MAVDCSVASSLPQTVPFDMTGNRAPRIGSERTGICWDGNEQSQHWGYVQLQPGF